MKNEIKKMPDVLTTKVRAKGKYAIYCSATDKGKEGTDYFYLDEIPEYIDLKAKVVYNEMYFKRLESMMINIADLSGIKHKGHLASVLGSMAERLTILYPGMKYKAIQVGLDGYFKTMADTNLILPIELAKEIDPNLINYFKLIDGKPTFDREKYERENLI